MTQQQTGDGNNVRESTRDSLADPPPQERGWRAVEDVLLLHGLPADVAEVWQDWWLPGQSVLRVIDHARAYVAAGVPAVRAVVWHRVGFGAGAGVALHRRGWTPADGLQVRAHVRTWAELEPWLETDLRPAAILRYVAAGVAPSEVQTFTSNEDQVSILDFLTTLND